MAKILIAEDDEAMRVFLAQALERAGHEVETVSNGADALDWIERDDCDLLLADVRMPGVDGISVARCVHLDKRPIPILFITGYAGDVLSARGLDTLGTQILPKPFKLSELVKKVGKVLAA